MAITAQDLVAREVHYCVSFLVSTLAGATAPGPTGDPLTDLVEQAMDLAAPIDDWEEAAIQAGWSETDVPGAFTNTDGSGFSVGGRLDTKYELLCATCDIEPYEREVFEHWIVSDWLADKLEAHGEKVDKDFAGMTVWARTTTGQAIYADGLMEEIAAEVNAAV